jgi:hypothetical protein
MGKFKCKTEGFTLSLEAENEVCFKECLDSVLESGVLGNTDVEEFEDLEEQLEELETEMDEAESRLFSSKGEEDDGEKVH